MRRPPRGLSAAAELCGTRCNGSARPGRTLQHLSMGMSRDFEVAIEEGATMVRVGSLLFEGVVE